MHFLDRPTLRATYDRHHVLDSLGAFAAQMRQAWAESRRVAIPDSYRAVRSIVVTGMGGSRWPLEIVRTVFADRLRVPMTALSDYSLPASVGRNTLVLVSSYSGTTEEPLAAAKIAKDRGAKLLALTLGGPLATLIRQWRIPAYQFTETHNPSHQPRLGTGYMFLGAIGLFAQAGLLRISSREVAAAIAVAEQAGKRWSEAAPFERNAAKQWAMAMKDRLPVIVAAEHLEATAEAFRNRVHENGKHFAVHFPIPGLNHHLLEGFGFPAANRACLGLFLDSDRYDERNRRRMAITKRVFERNGIPTEAVRFNGATRFEDAVLSLTFSGYATYWLSLVHRVDASKIPWVDYFKKELAKK